MFFGVLRSTPETHFRGPTEFNSVLCVLFMGLPKLFSSLFCLLFSIFITIKSVMLDKSEINIYD